MIEKTFGLFFANVVSLIHYPITAVEEARSRDRKKCHPPFPSRLLVELLDRCQTHCASTRACEGGENERYMDIELLRKRSKLVIPRVLITLTYRRVTRDNYRGGGGIPNTSTCLHSKDLHNHHHPAFLQIFEKRRASRQVLNTPLLLAIGQFGFQIRNPSLPSKRFCAVLGAKNEERRTKTKRKMDLVPFFARPKRKSRSSSVFLLLCPETTWKRLLRRLKKSGFQVLDSRSCQ